MRLTAAKTSALGINSGCLSSAARAGVVAVASSNRNPYPGLGSLETLPREYDDEETFLAPPGADEEGSAACDGR